VWNWGPEQIQSFEQLKTALIKEPVLQYPDYTKTYVLTTDASGFAVGAVLSQGTIGRDNPLRMQVEH
jgi:hypothetical protein